MTKINKLGKSTFVIAILSFLLVAVLAFGGTYAYFSDSATATGSVTLGHMTIDVKADGSTVSSICDITAGVPGQFVIGSKTEAETYTFDMGANSEEGTNIAAYVRFRIVAELTSPTGDSTGADSDIDADNFFLVDKTGLASKWQPATADGETTEWFYYATSASTLVTVGEGTNATADLKVQINPGIGKNESTFFMNATGTITIYVEAIQAEWLDGVETQSLTVEALADGWNGWKATGAQTTVTPNA